MRTYREVTSSYRLPGLAKKTRHRFDALWACSDGNKPYRLVRIAKAKKVLVTEIS